VKSAPKNPREQSPTAFYDRMMLWQHQKEQSILRKKKLLKLEEQGLTFAQSLNKFDGVKKTKSKTNLEN